MRKLAASSLLLLVAACGREPAAPEPATQDSRPAAAETAAVEKGRFAPRNDCSKLPGADDFRQRVLEAVQLRDVDAFAALADPAIKLDFGGGGGVDELKQRLRSGEQARDLWQSLETLLELGCAVGRRGDLIIPWYFGQDLGQIDATAALLVTGEDVPVLKEPRASAERIVSISWDLVNAVSFDRDQPYQRIVLPIGEQGFIATDKLRSVLDYRLLATRKNGQWYIDALVAGD